MRPQSSADVDPTGGADSGAAPRGYPLHPRRAYPTNDVSKVAAELPRSLTRNRPDSVCDLVSDGRSYIATVIATTKSEDDDQARHTTVTAGAQSSVSGGSDNRAHVPHALNEGLDNETCCVQFSLSSGSRNASTRVLCESVHGRMLNDAENSGASVCDGRAQRASVCGGIAQCASVHGEVARLA